MKRRRMINVWPAFADLMTVLAVVGLFTAAVMRQLWIQEMAHLEEKIHNEEMFEAIQQVQKVIDEISQGENLAFGADQSLQFGDDLVEFDLNSVEPNWKNGDGAERLLRFCDLVSSKLKDHAELFTVHVEGHTDKEPCTRDPNCNWLISSARAAKFVAFIRNEEYCPGGGAWEMRPIGFADTKPFSPTLGSPAEATRRIAVRIVPDYEKMLTAKHRQVSP